MIILVAATKGGVGKSTIVSNLAAIDVNNGHDPILVDSDRQGTAAAWAEVRDSQDVKRLPCVQKYGKGLMNELKGLAEKYDNVFVDSGGHDSPEMRSAMLAADLVLLVTRPSQVDVWAIPHMLELVAQAEPFNPNLKYFFVINGAHPSPNVKDADEFREMWEDQPICKTVLYQRRAYAKAPILGMAVTELTGSDRDPKAIEEVTSLYREVISNA